MLEFEWLWIFGLLPLPLVVRLFIKPAEPMKQAALRVPFLSDFQSLKRRRFKIFSKKLLLFLATISWILLLTAAAKPQWIGEVKQVPASGRDLMLALDLSGSMEEEDFVINNKRVNRLMAAKAVATEFISRRQGDRIGLIVFAKHPYLMMPLSFDLRAVQEMLNDTFIGLAEENKTGIGDAILLSLKRFQAQEETNRVLILLTDGANNTGVVSPEEAADFAAEEEMKIYTIGVGSDVSGRGLFTRRNNDLDEKTLKMIANKTAGRYFRARDTAELRKIYALLNELEPIERDAEFFRTQNALYHYPLFVAALLAVIILLAHTIGRSRQ